MISSSGVPPGPRTLCGERSVYRCAVECLPTGVARVSPLHCAAGWRFRIVPTRRAGASPAGPPAHTPPPRSACERRERSRTGKASARAWAFWLARRAKMGDKIFYIGPLPTVHRALEFQTRRKPTNVIVPLKCKGAAMATAGFRRQRRALYSSLNVSRDGTPLSRLY